MTLRDVVVMLDLFRTEESQWLLPTIFAEEPWNPDSKALVGWASMMGGLPPNAADEKMVRFTEVARAKELIADRSWELRAKGEIDALCDLLVEKVLAFESRPRLIAPDKK